MGIFGKGKAATAVGSPLNKITDPIGKAWQGTIKAPERWKGGEDNKEQDKRDALKNADEELLKQFGGKIPSLGDRSSMMKDGRLQGDAYLDPSKFQGNQGAINKLNQKATSDGPSTWMQMQLQQQQAKQMQDMGRASSQANSANAAARANLATKGGLSTGASERLARSGGQDLNMARQTIGAGAATNQLNTGIQDESNKNQLLGQAVQGNIAQNAQQIGLGQFNAQNTLAENNAGNAHNMTKYQEQMKGYGAGKAANAIANGGKK